MLDHELLKNPASVSEVLEVRPRCLPPTLNPKPPKTLAPVYPGVRAVVRPLLGLFHNAPGGKCWRHVLDQELLKKPASVSKRCCRCARGACLGLPLNPSNLENCACVVLTRKWISASAGGAVVEGHHGCSTVQCALKMRCIAHH